MEQLYIVEYGERRKAEKHICEYCEEEFSRRTSVSRPKKYCSANCGHKARRNKIEVKCHNCGEMTKKTPSNLKNSKHGFYFCGRKCKEEAQSLEGNCPEIRPSHYKDGITSYRQKMAAEIECGCVSCGVEEEYLLEIHHKDGNRHNNVRSNLEVVCANCHIKRHLKMVDGKMIFNWKSLTPR